VLCLLLQDMFTCKPVNIEVRRHFWRLLVHPKLSFWGVVRGSWFSSLTFFLSSHLVLWYRNLSAASKLPRGNTNNNWHNWPTAPTTRACQPPLLPQQRQQQLQVEQQLPARNQRRAAQAVGARTRKRGLPRRRSSSSSRRCSN
jgi:hypothetical protein